MYWYKPAPHARTEQYGAAYLGLAALSRRELQLNESCRREGDRILRRAERVSRSFVGHPDPAVRQHALETLRQLQQEYRQHYTQGLRLRRLVFRRQDAWHSMGFRQRARAEHYCARLHCRQQRRLYDNDPSIRRLRKLRSALRRLREASNSVLFYEMQHH